MNIVIVESPAKAKTINKYLGSDYEVFASYGHVRDLPSKDGSVDPDEDFAMSWAVDGKSSKRLADIARAVKGADRLILATDPDREGEAISWHVLEVLRAKKALNGMPVQRVVFNAITRDAVLDAMKHPREIDADLVDAYLARRALDYLVGFTLSPVLWRKLPGARSAGRVQSVALRLVCDRENEIEIFVPREYWSVEVTLETAANAQFLARVVNFDGKRITRLDIPDEAMARRVEAALKAGDYRVASIEAKPVRRNPPPPFTTSTLQQEASRKLGFSSARTMQVAQRLYEDGRITYMRTDGVDVAPEALSATRATIAKDFGPRYVPEQARHYKVKAKNAQEAHEAIRPTDPSRVPASLRGALEPDQARLYELIWKRLLASQMSAAEIERTTVEIAAGAGTDMVGLRATGQVVRFDGFLTLYQEGRDDDSDEEDSSRLPPMNEGESLTERGIAVDRHFTEPPPRYTEATLIKKMEELGIGRPSTYTSTLSVLRDRDYVRLEKRQLIPEDKGRLVTAFLSSFFRRYVEYDFTAGLEEKLDKISNGDISWKDVLREFWKQFSADVGDTKELRVSEVLEALNELLAPHVFPKPADGGDPRQCPSCGTGKLSLKLGKFGAFIGCSNYPECRFTRQLATNGENGGGAELGTDGVRELGQDPESGLAVTVRTGRFGPYLQLGEPTEEEKKPKRASLPKGWDAATIDLERALALLALPREVGADPETGTMITAGIGRYGPFVLHDGTYANLDSVEEVFSVGLNRAVSVLAEKRAGGGRGRGRATPKALKSLGDHPTTGGAITVRDGKYGPYVNHGKINATLPKDIRPEEVTMDTALELLAAKAGKSGARPKAKAKTTKAKPTKAKPKATKARAAKPKAAKPEEAAKPN